MYFSVKFVRREDLVLGNGDLDRKMSLLHLITKQFSDAWCDVASLV